MTPFYEAIAWLVVHIHAGLAPVFGKSSGASWALSIVLLTIAMRLLLFPLFVKQIRNQRAMQLLQPKMKELQAKYKNDKEKLNQEMMALWKEHGANPFSGCLPIIVQIPVFFALFRVLNSIKPAGDCKADSSGSIAHCFSAHYGISADLVHSAAIAKIFGVPISAAFDSSKDFLRLVGGDPTATKVLTVVMIVLMGASTFFTQRQLMARNKLTGGDTQMAQQQKILLYVLPLTFAVFGYRFPVGVLLYWLTTNVWSMGQQAIVIRRMDAAAAPAGPAVVVSGPAPGAKPVRPAAAPAKSTPAAPSTPSSSTTGPGPTNAATVPPKPGGNRRPANRRRNRRRR
ncbi:MAG TPA: membrane protein insertase YidC [Mycobacteriales bacterium]|nr:membrane protein insertase YidC [Mycobacteriales bacterium]